MARTSMMLITLFGATALVTACGSGGSSGTGGSGSGGSQTTATASSSSGTTTGGTGGSAADGGVMACEAACVQSQMAAYAKFATYQIASCGCAAGAPCNSDCSATCPNGSPSNACIMCLLTEAEKGTSSTCSMSAEASCASDAACNAFTTCVAGC